MLEANGRNHLLTLAYFQRIPGCALYGVGNGNGDGGGMPQPAEDLIRAWRRSRDEPLPPELRSALEASNNNTLFNALGATIDLLLRRITPGAEVPPPQPAPGAGADRAAHRRTRRIPWRGEHR